MDVTVRKADLSDIEAIMAVENQAFIKGIVEKRETFEERIKSFKDGFFVLCDERDCGKIVGYYCSEIWNSVPCDEKSFALDHDASKKHDVHGSVLYISSVALLKSYRGMGLGRFLFADCTSRVLKEFTGIKTAVLLVNEEWKGARHIYGEAGFTEYARLEGFFATQDQDRKSSGILMQTERNTLLENIR